jgi:hypothetical protein
LIKHKCTKNGYIKNYHKTKTNKQRKPSQFPTGADSAPAGASLASEMPFNNKYFYKKFSNPSKEIHIHRP